MPHTIGPWESNRNGNYWSILGPDRNLHGDGITSSPVAAIVQTSPEATENARLIAAAPDLLTALKRMLFEFDASNSTACKIAIKAIEKAEGKTL